FSFGDDELLAHRAAPAAPGPIADALAVLAELHAERNRRPVADTLARLLAATRAHAAFAHWQNGAEVVANVRRLGAYARRFDASRPSSFRAFIDLLERAAEEGDPDPIVDDAAAGVRVMTVHAAKGLEFPVVILADPGAPAAPNLPSRWVDGDAWF